MKELKNARIWTNEELRKIANLFQGRIINVSGERDQDKQGGYTATILQMVRHIGCPIFNYLE